MTSHKEGEGLIFVWHKYRRAWQRGSRSETTQMCVTSFMLRKIVCYVLVDENNVHVIALDVLLEAVLNVGDRSIWKLKWNTVRDHSCYSRVTCKGLLNRPHQKFGQYCAARCSILTKRDLPCAPSRNAHPIEKGCYAPTYKIDNKPLVLYLAIKMSSHYQEHLLPLPGIRGLAFIN